ncbi:MAG: hypothetical protein ACR2F6_19250 [Mycobacteriales bacterium]
MIAGATDEGAGRSDPGQWRRRLTELAAELVRHAREQGARGLSRGVAQGRVLADVLADQTPRIPIRSQALLLAAHPGMDSDQIAAALIQASSRSTAAVGAAAGVLSAAEFAAPPLLLAAPVQVAAETVAVAAIEIRLLAELHELYQVPVPVNPGERTAAYLIAWAERRRVAGPRAAPGAVRDAAIRRVRARLVRQLGRNSSSLAPMLVGAAAGSALNSRGTKAFGRRILADLGRRPPR